jgi:predicted transposase YbfD/YdcC
MGTKPYHIDLKENKKRHMSYIRLLVLRTTGAIIISNAITVQPRFTSGERHGNS